LAPHPTPTPTASRPAARPFGPVARTLLTLLPLAFLLAVPLCKVPIKDEGGYFRIALALPEHGLDVYRRFDMTSTSLTVVGGGYLALLVLGKTLSAARAFVLAASVLGLLGAARLLRRLDAPAWAVALFVAILAVNPLFARYAHIFTTDALFLVFCLLSLLGYAVGLERKDARALLLGALFAALSIYTRQPGLVLPLVPLAVAAGRWLFGKERPGAWVPVCGLLPYAAFLPLALFFHEHSGSFIMYVSKPWEHQVGGLHPQNILWGVNFLGFFTAPFLIPVLLGHGASLRAWKGLPWILSLLLAPAVFLGAASVGGETGGLGRIFQAAHLPHAAVWLVVLVCQFAGVLTLALLGVRALDRSAADLYLLLFVLLYLALLGVKGGNLLVHYAAPLAPASAWVAATAGERGRPGLRWVTGGLVLGVAAFTLVWAQAESALGRGIHRGVMFLEEDPARRASDRIYTCSATALQVVKREHVTFDPAEAAYFLVTPEDGLPVRPPAGAELAGAFPVSVLGRTIGSVQVYRASPRGGPGGAGRSPEETPRSLLAM